MMKKGCLFLLFLLIILLCVSTASAEYFSAALPANEYLYDACLLDGSHLAVMTNANVYRVDLDTGESTCLAPRLGSSTFLFCSDDGGVYTMTSDDLSHDQQHLYRVDTASSAWVEEAVITLEQETYGALDAAFVGDLLFFTLAREGQPSLLASYDRQLGEVVEYGPFSLNEGCGGQLIVADGTVMTYDMDYKRMQAYLFQCDSQSGQLQQTAVNLPVSGDIYALDYNSAQKITVSSTESSLSDILNMRNSDIDLIGFRPESAPSLKTIKKKHYFVDLSASGVLTRQAERLYPSLSKALWTDGGELSAWITDAQPYMFGADESLLAEYGLQAPTTIPELLDQMKLLTDEGVFEGGAYIPFDAMDFDQKSLIEYSLRRYIFEQELQGERLSFDSESLRSLLQRILDEVPREAQYTMETGDESPVYSLYNVYTSISKSAKLPLRIGEDSPRAIQTQAYLVLINPYSAHQAEAMAYLEYIAQQSSEADYVLYQDKTEPKVSSYAEAQLKEIDRQIELLSAQEDSAENRDQLQALQESRARCEANLYEIDSEDIAAWQAAANGMVVQEETLYTSELNALVDRLVKQNVSVDAFLDECNRYAAMVYMENDE